MLGMLACCYQLLILLIARPASFIAYLRQFDDLILSAFEIKVPVLRKKMVFLPGIDGEERSGDLADSYFDPFRANAVRALFWFLLPLESKGGPFDRSSSSRN